MKLINSNCNLLDLLTARYLFWTRHVPYLLPSPNSLTNHPTRFKSSTTWSHTIIIIINIICPVISSHSRHAARNKSWQRMRQPLANKWPNNAKKIGDKKRCCCCLIDCTILMLLYLRPAWAVNIAKEPVALFQTIKADWRSGEQLYLYLQSVKTHKVEVYWPLQSNHLSNYLTKTIR